MQYCSPAIQVNPKRKERDAVIKSTNEIVTILWQLPLSHLFDKPILSPMKLLYHFNNMGLSKVTHIMGR